MPEGFLNLLKFAAARPYEKGEVIFRQGDIPAGIFCLQSGKAKIFKLGINGLEQIIRLAKPGDLLGYRALLAEEEYNATAKTLESSHVLFLKKGEFLSLSNTPKLSQHLLTLLCHDLRFAEDHLLDFVQMSSREKMAKALLFLKEAYGKAEKNNGILIDIALTRKELSELAGVVSETAVRALGEFKREGLIQLEGKKIIIQDLASLKKKADLSN